MAEPSSRADGPASVSWHRLVRQDYSPLMDDREDFERHREEFRKQTTEYSEESGTAVLRFRVDPRPTLARIYKEGMPDSYAKESREYAKRMAAELQPTADQFGVSEPYWV